MFKYFRIFQYLSLFILGVAATPAFAMDPQAQMNEYSLQSTYRPLLAMYKDGKVDSLIAHIEEHPMADDLKDYLINIACIRNDIEFIHFLHKNVIDINSKKTSSKGIIITPLHSACFYPNNETIKLLIDLGADVNAKDQIQRTPLHNVCEAQNLFALQLLVSNRADIHACSTADYTPLHVACLTNFKQGVQFLINLSANVNALTHKGATPLHFACARQYPGIVKILLDHGADATVQDELGVTALDYAYDKKNQQIIDLLESHVNLLREKESEQALKELLQEEGITLDIKKPKKKKKHKKKKTKTKKIIDDQVVISQENEEIVQALVPLKITESAQEKLPLIKPKAPEPTPPHAQAPKPKYYGEKKTDNSVARVKAEVVISRAVTKPVEKHQECEVILDKNFKWPKGILLNQTELIEESLSSLIPGTSNADLKKLRDGSSNWRLRVGKYRIIFKWDTATYKVHVLSVDLRKRAYKNLESLNKN